MGIGDLYDRTGTLHRRIPARRDDHVLDSVGNYEIAVLEPAHVAGVVPAVGIDGFPGRFGVVPVAFHHIRPPV